MLTLGYLQFEPCFGAVADNLHLALQSLRKVNADLMVLPELAFTGYAFKDRAEAQSLAEDPARSPAVAELHSLCREKGMHVVTGFAEKSGDKCFNSALLIGPNGLAGTYRKLHLFNTEKDCFDPGDRPLQVYNVKGAQIGMMICFDWIFPEVARTLALKGADIICHPANLVIPDKCQQAMSTRCIENRVFAVTANRYGRERDIDFTGASQIVSPDGELLHRSPPSDDELFTAEIDPSRARDKHITPRNDLFADRRPGLDSL